jgi:transcriptional regulator with XRE-family HTH domain
MTTADISAAICVQLLILGALGLRYDRAMNDAESIGTRIGELLAERHPGKPRRLICSEAGISYKTLSDALAGKTVPRYATVERLAAYLDVSPGYLYTGEDDEIELSDAERLRSIERQISELTGTLDELANRVAAEERQSRSTDS